MKKTIAKLTLAAASGFLLSGCIGPIISHKSTVYKDAERTKVEFESDAAARLFYETLSRNSKPHKQSESTTNVEIPVLFEHSRTVVSGANTAFNEAVAVCDSNKDGRITELEAKVYANVR